eukprot:6085869-Alexandrium_andersonii.AAC.1
MEPRWPNHLHTGRTFWSDLASWLQTPARGDRGPGTPHGPTDPLGCSEPSESRAPPKLQCLTPEALCEARWTCALGAPTFAESHPQKGPFSPL